MSRVSQLLVAFAALVAVATAYDKCYKKGERCIGAPGKPAVKYYPCCDGYECTAKDKSYNGYGLICAKKGSAPAAPKCYKEGQRCIGAPGKPAVPYSPCCDGMSCSADDKSYNGYGKVCAKGYAPKPPKCYKEGERCIGAPGKPAVPYSPCCDGMECSADDKSYNGYGKVCAKKTYPTPPKCIKDGEECKNGGVKCCGYSKCVRGYGKYAFVCEAGATAPVTTTKKCVAEEGKCGKGYDECCAGTRCQKAKKYSYEERCMKY